jgi:hypothetical protein
MSTIFVPKGVKKSDLYDYINNLYEKRQSQLKKKYCESLKPIADEILKLSEGLIEKLSTILNSIETLDLEFLKYLTNNNYGVSCLKNSSWYFQNSPKHVVDKFLTTKAENVQALIYDDKVIPLRYIPHFKTWNAIVSNYNKELEEAQKLRDELTLIVKNEKKAQKAYKRLAELGLDMTSFQENFKEESYLPDIVRTSVSVEIFNNLGDEQS